MASRQEHLRIDREILGKEHNEVHQWIDSKFPEYRSYPHWLHYHHLEAIKKKYKEFSPQYNSAYLHILYDFLGHFGRAYVPKNEKELDITLCKLGII